MSCSQPEIRLLSECDAAEFWQLRLRALQEEPGSFGSTSEEFLKNPLAEVAKRLQSSKDAFVLGAFNPELMGMLGFFRQQEHKMEHKGTIWGMYVSPVWRGQGIGRALLLAAISRASLLPGLTQLILTVVTTNEAAYHLYLSLGFTVYGIEREALKLDNCYLDQYLMVLKLEKS